MFWLPIKRLYTAFGYCRLAQLNNKFKPEKMHILSGTRAETHFVAELLAISAWVELCRMFSWQAITPQESLKSEIIELL